MAVWAPESLNPPAKRNMNAKAPDSTQTAICLPLPSVILTLQFELGQSVQRAHSGLLSKDVDTLNFWWLGEEFARLCHERCRKPSAQVCLTRTLVREGVEDGERRGIEAHGKPKRRPAFLLNQGAPRHQELLDFGR